MRMISMALLVAAGSVGRVAAATPVAPIDGFQGAHWGISSEQLKAVFPAIVPEKDRPGDFACEVTVMEKPAHALFKFAGNKLAAVAVTLVPATEDGKPAPPQFLSVFLGAQSALNGKYGFPLYDHPAPATKTAMDAGDFKAIHALIDAGDFRWLLDWAAGPGTISLEADRYGVVATYSSAALAKALEAAHPRPPPAKPSGL